MWYKYIKIAVSIWLLQIGKGTGNREQGTGNREQGTGNREQGEERNIKTKVWYKYIKIAVSIWLL
ncbi:MAG: hypothetical protein ACK6A9_03330, partial [Dolichospermum sp.]